MDQRANTASTRIASSIASGIAGLLIVGALGASCAKEQESVPPPVATAGEPPATKKLPPAIARLIEDALREEQGQSAEALFPPDSLSGRAVECPGNWQQKAQGRRRQLMGELRNLQRRGAELFDAELAGEGKRFGIGDKIGRCTVKRALEKQKVDLLFVGEQPGGRYRESRVVNCVRIDGDERWYLMTL